MSDTEPLTKLVLGVGTLFIILLIAIPMGLWNAFAIQILWGWYATPIFHVPVPNVFAIAGLWLIPNSLTATIVRSWENKEKSSERLLTMLSLWAAGPPILIFAGWVYRFWAF